MENTRPIHSPTQPPQAIQLGITPRRSKLTVIIGTLAVVGKLTTGCADDTSATASSDSHGTSGSESTGATGAGSTSGPTPTSGPNSSTETTGEGSGSDGQTMGGSSTGDLICEVVMDEEVCCDDEQSINMEGSCCEVVMDEEVCCDDEQSINMEGSCCEFIQGEKFCCDDEQVINVEGSCCDAVDGGLVCPDGTTNSPGFDTQTLVNLFNGQSILHKLGELSVTLEGQAGKLNK